MFTTTDIKLVEESPLRFRSFDDMEIFEKLHEGIENGKIKIIGSYLCKSNSWDNEASDIDVVTFDLLSGWKVRQNAIKNKIRVQIIFLSEIDFHSIEYKTTLHNFGFSLCKNIFGENQINGSDEAWDLYSTGSRILCPNNLSITIFKRSGTAFKQIQKYLREGFVGVDSYTNITKKGEK